MPKSLCNPIILRTFEYIKTKTNNNNNKKKQKLH